MSKLRFGRPSPAMTVACVALFVALAGGAYAVSKAPRNSVVSKSIKRGQVKSSDLKNNRVKGKDIKDDTLEGRDVKDGSLDGAEIENGSLDGEEVKNDGLEGNDINESTLAGVDAETLDGKSADCAAGTQLYLGECWESAARAAAPDWLTAASTCASAGGTLPSTEDLRAFGAQPGITLAATDEWTEDIVDVTALNAFNVVTVSDPGGVNFTNQIDDKGYRCVIPLVR